MNYATNVQRKLKYTYTIHARVITIYSLIVLLQYIYSYTLPTVVKHLTRTPSANILR